MVDARFYLIDAEQLRSLRRVASCLYKEERLTGDQMRDLGHALTAVANTCEQLDVTDTNFNVKV